MGKDKFEKWAMELIIIVTTLILGVVFHELHPLFGCFVFFLGGIIFKNAIDFYKKKLWISLI